MRSALRRLGSAASGWALLGASLALAACQSPSGAPVNTTLPPQDRSLKFEQRAIDWDIKDKDFYPVQSQLAAVMPRAGNQERRFIGVWGPQLSWQPDLAGEPLPSEIADPESPTYKLVSVYRPQHPTYILVSGVAPAVCGKRVRAAGTGTTFAIQSGEFADRVFLIDAPQDHPVKVTAREGAGSGSLGKDDSQWGYLLALPGGTVERQLFFDANNPDCWHAQQFRSKMLKLFETLGRPAVQ